MNVPILLIIFNRFETTVLVFEKIKEIRPKKLYLAADGPRFNVPEDKDKTKRVRDYVISNIDWDCEVKTLFREKNFGCKKNVSEAITWMFEFEDKGIILEDDCVPDLTFFYFCEKLLEKYKDNESIGVINGNNFQDGIKRGEYSYYFSKYNHVWGWATWKRAWRKYSEDIEFLDDFVESEEWKKTNDFFERRYWKRIFYKVKQGEITSAWGYPWTACVWYNKMLSITPNVNLVKNIGFGSDSTHTKEINSPLSNISVKSIDNLYHPKYVKRHVKADIYTYKKVFEGDKFYFPKIIFTFIKFIFEKIYFKI